MSGMESHNTTKNWLALTWHYKIFVFCYTVSIKYKTKIRSTFIDFSDAYFSALLLKYLQVMRYFLNYLCLLMFIGLFVLKWNRTFKFQWSISCIMTPFLISASRVNYFNFLCSCHDVEILSQILCSRWL